MRTETEGDLGLWEYGVDRGRRMADFFEREIAPLNRMSVLDVGCASGGIGFAFAERCQAVVGIDRSKEFISRARQRASERRLSHVSFVLAEVPPLSLASEAFDLVILNGILEWLGRGWSVNPDKVQRYALQEARRVLRPGGFVYLGIENRLWPSYMLHDPHVGLPLVNALPRKIANWLSLRLRRSPYEVWIYSHRGLERMLHEAGFFTVNLFLPVFDYRLPFAIVSAGDKGQLMSEIGKYPAHEKFPMDPVQSDLKYEQALANSWPRVGKRGMQLIVALNVQHLFWPSFVLTGRKGATCEQRCEVGEWQPAR